MFYAVRLHMQETNQLFLNLTQCHQRIIINMVIVLKNGRY